MGRYIGSDSRGGRKTALEVGRVPSEREGKLGLFWGISACSSSTRPALHYIYSVADVTSFQQQAVEQDLEGQLGQPADRVNIS